MKPFARKPLYSALLLSLGLGAASAWGEQSSDKFEEEKFEEVTVWGTKVWASSVAMDEEAVAIKQVDHISDLLRALPGVDVGGAHSLNQRITIRSMDDKDLRITIDGANQNTYMYHHMGNLQIHADILSSAEIELGNNSVVNGGLGGTVRFTTRSADELLEPGKKIGARAQLGYASNAANSAALTGYGKFSDTLDFLVYGNRVERDDYEVGGGKILSDQGEEIPGTDGKVRGFEGDLTDALVKLGWQLSANQKIKLGYEAYKDKGDYTYRPDMGLVTDLTINAGLGGPLLWPTEFTRDTITVNYDLSWGGHSTLSAAVFTNTSTLERDENGWTGVPRWDDYAGIIRGDAKNTGVNLIARSRLDRHHLTYGGEYIRYNTEFYADYNNIPDEFSGEKAIGTAIYLEDRIAFSDKVFFIPGIRYNNYNIESRVVDDHFDAFTGALALEYQVTRDLLLHASSTQLFKGPEIGEVFTGAGLYDQPNQAIEAETGVNSELAIAWRNEIFNAGATLFNTRIDDYIYDYASNGVTGFYGKDNVGDMTIKGFEAYAGFDFNHWTVLLTYSKADSRLSAFAEYSVGGDDPATNLEGARLDRKQGDTISVEVDYQIPSINLTLHWDMLWVDDIAAGKDLDGATLNNAKNGFNVHNVAVRWTPNGVMGGFSLTFGAENLFDEFYASQSSRTGVSLHPRFGELYLQDFEPGRNIKLTLAYRL
jgi:hemoglobin/transferrin/lactoferrin receptor protein